MALTYERKERGMGNWGEMLPEMLSLICKRVSFYEDLVAFGGVCSTWRHEAVKQNLGQPLKPPFPWLMLAENQDDDVREFYSLTERKSYRFELPELRGKKCMETKGWIVTASDKGEMALVHPLTHVTIPLPHQQNTLSEVYNENGMEPFNFVQKVVLSSPPKTKNDRDCVLMILHGGMGQIGLCRLGDKVWTVLENNFKGATESVEYHRGKFYVSVCCGEVWEYDVIGKSNDTITVSQRKIEVNIGMGPNQGYLVDSAGSLLVVLRDVAYLDENYNNDPTTKWLVIEIDVEQGGYKEVESLGTRSIFLGHSATLSVDTIFYPALIPNSIYFTDDYFEFYLYSSESEEGGGTNMGVYNLEDKSVRPHYSGKSLSFVCPPVWTFLTTIPLRNR